MIYGMCFKNDQNVCEIKSQYVELVTQHHSNIPYVKGKGRDVDVGFMV